MLQGERQLEEQLLTLLEVRMEMDAEWAAAQAQAAAPHVYCYAASFERLSNRKKEIRKDQL